MSVDVAAEKTAKTAFLQLRPICSAAANIPNVANFSSLLAAIEDVEVKRARSSSMFKGRTPQGQRPWSLLYTVSLLIYNIPNDAMEIS